jgi:hypothetical protein
MDKASTIVPATPVTTTMCEATAALITPATGYVSEPPRNLRARSIAVANVPRRRASHQECPVSRRTVRYATAGFAPSLNA